MTLAGLVGYRAGNNPRLYSKRTQLKRMERSRPIGIQSNQFHNSKWVPSFQIQNDPTHIEIDSAGFPNVAIRTESF